MTEQNVIEELREEIRAIRNTQLREIRVRQRKEYYENMDYDG